MLDPGQELWVRDLTTGVAVRLVDIEGEAHMTVYLNAVPVRSLEPDELPKPGTTSGKVLAFMQGLLEDADTDALAEVARDREPMAGVIPDPPEAEPEPSEA